MITLMEYIFNNMIFTMQNVQCVHEKREHFISQYLMHIAYIFIRFAEYET